MESGDTATVTFSDGTNKVVVSGLANGTTTVDLSSLSDGTITSSLTSTNTAGNTLSATGNSVALDTDKAVTPTLVVNDTADHVINASEAKAVSYTIAGLESGDTATVTFSDGTNKVVVSGLANGTTTVDLSSLSDGTITSSLTSTDTAGNTL